MRVLTDGIMLGFAVGISVCDWKRRRIPVKWLVVYSIATISCVLFYIEGNLISMLGGIMIGAIFFLISRLTNEAIGYGDAWMITLLGAYVGGKDLVRLLFTASFLAAVVSLVWMWKQGWKREGSLPFVPFLTVGLLEVIFL